MKRSYSRGYPRWIIMIGALFVVTGYRSTQGASVHSAAHTTERMQIHFERTGGVTGRSLTATLDTETLSPEEAHRLREMVDAAGFFELPAVIVTPAPGVDRFYYTLTVDTAGRQHTVHTSDAAAPEALRPLLDWLTDVARRTQRGR